MNTKEFMKKTNVKTRKTVDRWVTKGLVPMVGFDKAANDWVFPESARRPFIPRCKPNASADVIRTSMVIACMKRHYFSRFTYLMDESEFDVYINQLICAELICRRVADGVVYYDSTLKADAYKNRSYNEKKKFVMEAVGVIVSAVVEGITKGVLAA